MASPAAAASTTSRKLLLRALAPCAAAPPAGRTLSRAAFGGQHRGARMFSSEQPRDRKKGLFYQKEIHVPSFGGSLSVKSPFDVRVTPLGAHEYPNLDRTFIKLRTEATPQNIDGKKNTKIDVDQDGGTLVVETTNVGVPSDLARHVKKEIQAPMIYSVKVEATGRARAEVAEFIESEHCRVRAEDGDVEVSKVKSGAVEVEAGAGDVTCLGHIQGTVRIRTGSGNVIGNKRFTGDSLEIATDSGDIRLASCYSDTSTFVTNTGSMYLRNLHNESYMSIYEKGKVTVLGLDGSANIFVKKGEIDCQVSVVRHESRIHIEEGDVHLKVSDQQPLKLLIDANDIIPDTKFKSVGKLSEEGGGHRKRFQCSLHPNQFAAELVVHAEDGNVVLESQDWAASLGLKMQPRT